MTEFNGNNTNYEYDEVSRLTKVIYPAGNITQYTYDGVNNRLTEIIDDQIISYVYDKENRLLSTNYANYTYDKNNS